MTSFCSPLRAGGTPVEIGIATLRYRLKCLTPAIDWHWGRTARTTLLSSLQSTML